MLAPIALGCRTRNLCSVDILLDWARNAFPPSNHANSREAGASEVAHLEVGLPRNNGNELPKTLTSKSQPDHGA